MTASVWLEDVVAALEAGPVGGSVAAFLDACIVWPDASVRTGEEIRDREHIDPEARELVAAHRRLGHTVVLLSSLGAEQTSALARLLDVPAVLQADTESHAGPDAAAQVLAFAAEHAVDLPASHAYASRASLAPVLAAVGHPRPTNPDKQLAAAAEAGGWPLLRWRRSDAESLLRTVAAYGTLVPSMLGGLAMGLVNRDRNQIVQYGINTWVDRLFALTGVRLRVQGEENLWLHRPAVFVYNHRNNFDPYVVIRLVRRDWGAVGKKELAGPFVGVAQWLTPNVAYVDRSNSEKAIQSLESVTQLLGRGVSVLVAPEGTRSVDRELGVFKKGPFRMAMRAGVPVVPVVIRNADCVAGRDATVIRRGTIDVAVLPPVQVTDWTDDDLDVRVEEVRALFAQTLADWPSSPGGTSRP